MHYRTFSCSLVFLLSTFSFAQDSQRQYLSGKGIDDAVPWEFMINTGNKSGQWTTIPVPWNWDTLGFGQLQFGRFDAISTEQGKYRHRFQVPSNWAGRKIFLVFEGSMTDTEAWVNGMSAGPKHIGSFYEFRYDVTSSIKAGQENLLEVTVDEESENPSVNRAERRADYWTFGGIFRPVYLEAVPQQHLRRVAINAKHDGSFAMDVFAGAGATATAVQAQIMDMAGNAVGAPVNGALVEGKGQLTTRIEGAKTWTAETPNLYQVEVRLLEGNNVVHRMRERFGFRTIEIRAGDGIYLNNQRITLKGPNRHSHWPESGRATSERISRMDIMLMKEMNCNAVRMSHYPPDDHFLDLCDELGLYVLDELAGWQQPYDTPTARRLIEEMVTHDVNHPSILFWDNGNEQRNTRNNEVNDDFAIWDPQKREVLHPQARFRNVDATHYPGYDVVERLANGNVVFINTEFLHGMFDGGAGAGLEEYWELMRNSKVFGGAFLWAWADETIKRPELGGWMDGASNQAPDGVVGPYREKEGSFYTAKQIWSPIHVTRSESGEFTIENRYDFTPSDQCTFTLQWRKFNSPISPSAGFTVLSEQKWNVPSIKPHERATVNSVPSPSNAAEADALALRVNDAAGRELWTYVWPLQNRQIVPRAGAGETPRVRDDPVALDVTTGNLVIRFSKSSGRLAGVFRDGKPFPLLNGPRLAVGETRFGRMTHRVDGNDVVVEPTYTGDLNNVQWRIRPDGWAHLSYTYSATGPQDFYGVCFDLPAEKVKSKRWLGNGPFRVWQNRTAGATLNVWETAYNNTQTGYADWVYPEFKGYFGNVRWMQLQTTDGPILVVLEDPSQFVQVLQPEFPGDPKPGGNAQQMLSGNAWAAFPDAGFSILHGIPPIGSKFRTAESTGPKGQKSIAQGEYRGSIWVYFGSPAVP